MAENLHQIMLLTEEDLMSYNSAEPTAQMQSSLSGHTLSRICFFTQKYPVPQYPIRN